MESHSYDSDLAVALTALRPTPAPSSPPSSTPVPRRAFPDTTARARRASADW